MVEVTLNETEVKLATYFGKAVFLNNKKVGAKERKISNQGSEEMTIDGFAAEIAFCKANNVYPDLEIGKWEDWDCIVPGMGKVDVKFTDNGCGRLLVPLHKAEKPPDSYALMTGRMPHFVYVGWEMASEVLQDSNIVDLGYGPTYGVDQYRLRQPL